MVDARQLDIILKIAADRQAANQTAQVVDNIDDGIDALSKKTETVSQRLANISRESRIDRIGDQFGKMARKIGDTDKAAEMLQKRLQQIGATEPEIARATSAFASRAGVGESGGARLSPYLATLGREVKSLPAIRIPGAGALSTDAVAKMVGLIGTLPPVAGALIPVLGGVATAFVALETVTSKAKESLTSAVNANKAYYELIGNGTGVEDGRKRLQELQREQAAQQQELASITTAQSQAFKDAVKTYGDAGARLLFGLGNISTADDELSKRQDELTKSIGANKTEQEGLNRALNDGTLASNDYRKAIEAEAKIKSDAALAGANDEYQKQLKLQQEGLMSSSQLMSKITDSIQQQNAAQAALNKLQADKARGVIGPEIDKQIADFQIQIGRLGADITRLYGEFADRRAIEDAIQSEKDIAAARKEVDKINDDVNKSTAKYKDDLAGLADKLKTSLADLETAFNNANAEAEIDRLEKLQDVLKDSNDKQVERQTKYNDEKIKIEEDYQKRVVEIEKDFSRSSAQAIQDRNAVALDAAEQKRKDELEDAKTTRDGNLKEREREYQAELRQLRDNNAKRIAEINLDFQRQAEQRARKYAFDQQQLELNNQREIAARTAAYDKQLTDLRSNLQQNTALWAQAGTAIVNYVKSVKDSINNILGGGSSAVVNGAVTNPNIGDALGGIFGFGASPSNGANNTGLGVRAPKAAGAALAGGIAVNVNGVGLNRNGVIREITKQLTAEFDAAGF